MNGDCSDPRFEELYRCYYRATCSLFVRRGFTAEDARDLAQNTFIRVFKGMASYRGGAAWAWILKIADHVWHNELRYRKAERRRAQTDPIDDPDRLADETRESPIGDQGLNSPEDEVLKMESTRLLQQALSEFDPVDRHVLLLWIQGFKYREIATAMRMTMDAVKTRLFRAKKHLKKRLGDYYAELDLPQGKGG